MLLNRSKIISKICLTNHQHYLFTVRVRYAPSPTGMMHIGGLRTALFNYLFAKNQNGTFIVRIQDTDKNRQVPGSIQNIFQTLKWIGITPDESISHGGEHGPYVQSQRLAIYKNFQKHLLKNSMAYPCFCNEVHTENQKEPIPYNGKCRGLPLEEIKTRIKNNEQYAVRIKSDIIPLPNTFVDQIFGQLEFKGFDDFVIIRRNGWPTFHFANVVDDWQMKITHVMRGEEWLTNTNKHIYLYKLLGVPIPKFVHLPLIKAMNGKKLAKRDPDSSIKDLQNNQYEIQAIRCFLYQLGLHKSEESKQKVEKKSQSKKKKGQQINVQDSAKKETKSAKIQLLKLLTFSEMISQFALSKITRVPVKFDKKQLDHLNKQAIKKRWKHAQQNKEQMKYFLSKMHSLIPSSKSYSDQYNIKTLASIAQRLNLISDIKFYKYYFEEPNYQDQDSRKDFKKLFGTQATLEVNQTESKQIHLKVTNYDSTLYQKNMKILHNLRIILEHVLAPSNYNEIQIAKLISEYLYQSPYLQTQDVYHLLRYMVSGRKSGPNITLACAIIGRDSILKRISRFSEI